MSTFNENFVQQPEKPQKSIKELQDEVALLKSVSETTKDPDLQKKYDAAKQALEARVANIEKTADALVERHVAAPVAENDAVQQLAEKMLAADMEKDPHMKSDMESDPSMQKLYMDRALSRARRHMQAEQVAPRVQSAFTSPSWDEKRAA